MIEPRPSTNRRLLVAAVIGVVVAIVAWGSYRHQAPGALSDFDQCWIAARAFISRQDPYLAVLAAGAAFPLAYPLPAVLIVIPFTVLPLSVARIAFVAVGAAVCAYGVTWRSWHPLFMLTSAAFLESLLLAQWTPMLVGAALIPAMSWLLIAKPNMGLSLGAGWFSKELIFGCVFIVAISFALWPGWPSEWLAALRAMHHFRAPALLWGGQLLLLAVTRWRRPEARFLLVSALIPQTMSLYAALPLFLVADTRMQTIALGLLSYAAYGLFLVLGPYESIVEQTRVAGALVLALMMLPCLILILRRPNEGPVPTWIERGIVAARRALAGPN